MPQLYPPSANALVRWSLIGGGVFVVLLVTALTFLARTSNNRVGVPVAQPVDFPHNTHVVDLGLDCRYCHSTVETSNTASVPSTEPCMTCHSQIRTNTPQLEPVVVRICEWQVMHVSVEGTEAVLDVSTVEWQ